MGIKRLSIQTTADRTVSNQNLILPTGGSVSTAVNSIVYTDANYNTLTANAAATTFGNFRIIGTNFVNGANVILANTSSGTISSIVSNTTFISSNEIRANVSVTAGNYALYIFNPNGTAAIYYSGVTFEPYPIWTSTSYASSGTVYVQLLTSSTAIEQPITYSLVSGTLPTGTTLSANGLISGTATGISGLGQTFTFTVAATDIYNETTQASISLTISLGDQYFDYTTLLLNGETNTTTYIADASTNNFALTVNGAANPNRFSPLWGAGYYGNYFDGSTGYLSLPASTQWLMSGNFTLEAWIYSTSFPAFSIIFDQWFSSSSGVGNWQLGLATGKPTWYYDGNSLISSSTALSLNIWYHMAAVRSGTTLTIYINGTSVATGTFAGTPGINNTLWIGSQHSGGPLDYFPGYISNARIVNGTAVYTSAFTPPTAPLTAIANTVLLTCQSNQFIDNSTNAFALTPNGTVKVVPNQPFGVLPSGVQNYGSSLFDGSTGYLTVSSSTTFAFGTGNFTIEAWVYLQSYPASSGSTPFGTTNGATSGYYFNLGQDINSLRFTSNASGSWADNLTVTSGNGIPLYTWTHVAFVRNGGTLTIYKNGISVASATGASAYNFTSPSNAGYIGYVSNGISSQYFNGYFSNIRVVSSAVYTTNFTPPTTPLTAISNTSLLTLQYKNGVNNNTFYDDSVNNFALTRTGTPTQGTFSPFSQAGWSYYFAGGSNWVSANSSPISTTNSTFTVEGWIYMTAVPVGTTPCVIGDMTPGGNNDSWSFGPMGSSPVVSFYWYDGAAKTVSGNTVMSLNTWYHIAVSINANAISMYVNGVQQTLTGTTTLTNRTGSVGYIGLGEWTSAVSAYYIGYASSLRISNIALYSSSFTPPTTTFTTSSNTVFLTAQSNRFVDLSTNNYTLTPTGASVQAFSPFPPSATYSVATNGGSMYFGSSSDNVGQASTTAWVFGGDFTIEGWFYFLPAGAGTSRSVVNTSGGNVYLNTDNTLHYVFQSVTDFASSQVVNAGQWVHLVVCRNGGTYRFFVNGNMTISTGSSSSIPATAGINVGTSAFYAHGVKITNGVSLYNSSFAIPTTITTGTSTNSLILLATNSGIQDATGKNNLITFGTTKTQSNTVKYGTGAMYFDGSSFINSPAVNGYGTGDFGTGDFTVEFWMNNSMSSGSFISVLGTQDIPGNATAGMWRVSIRGNATPGILFDYTNGSAFTDVTFTTTSYNDGTWHHVAVTRASGSVRAFVDGTQVGTTQSITQNLNSGQKIYIGYQPQDGVYYTGYLDDIRITKGIARYTTNFTPPSTTFLTQ